MGYRRTHLLSPGGHRFSVSPQLPPSHTLNRSRCSSNRSRRYDDDDFVVGSGSRRGSVLVGADGSVLVSGEARLGLLGRLASLLCLIELFSSAPGEQQVIDCVGKLIAFRQELWREADRVTREQDREGGPKPAPLGEPS
jgi:hypothetical protein